MLTGDYSLETKLPKLARDHHSQVVSGIVVALLVLLGGMIQEGIAQTLTGRDLLQLPNVTFPTRSLQPVLQGDSLFFGPGGQGGFGLTDLIVRRREYFRVRTHRRRRP
jgi:hypothetical protein